MSHPAQNFASRLAALDRTSDPASMMLLPRGRAYRNADGFHIDQIHLPAIAENMMAQGLLRARFERASLPQRTFIYGGVAGFANLVNIAAIKPDAAALFDINPAQTAFWNDIVIPGLAKHRTVHSFFGDLLREGESKSRLLMREFETAARALGQNIPPHFVTSPWRNVNYPAGWAASFEDDNALCAHYSRLHVLARRGALGALTLDIADTQGCSDLKRAMPQGFDVLYISNVFNFLGRPDRIMVDWAGRELDESQYERARGNVRHLLNPNGAYVLDEEGGIVSRHFPDHTAPQDWRVPD